MLQSIDTINVLLFYIILFSGLCGVMTILIVIGCIFSPQFRQEFIDDWNREL